MGREIQSKKLQNYTKLHKITKMQYNQYRNQTCTPFNQVTNVINYFNVIFLTQNI